MKASNTTRSPLDDSEAFRLGLQVVETRAPMVAVPL